MPAAGAVTAGTAVYTFALCKAILQGFRNQMRVDGRMILGVVGLQRPEESMTDIELLKICQADGDTIELNVAEQEERFTDAITGQVLKPDLVRAARREEMEYFAAEGVWTRRPRAECFERTGKRPVTVKWVDVNKGDDESPNYRSRLVAREIRLPGEDPILAPRLH